MSAVPRRKGPPRAGERPDLGRPFTVDFDVRFPEVDSYGVVWHGHYLLYFEVARNALCAAGGLTPAVALARGYRVPITKLDLALRRSARLDDRLRVATWLSPPDAARLSMHYEVYRLAGGKADDLLATGRTEQVVLDPSGQLLLAFPRPVQDLVERILAFQRGEFELPASQRISVP